MTTIYNKSGQSYNTETGVKGTFDVSSMPRFNIPQDFKSTNSVDAQQIGNVPLAKLKTPTTPSYGGLESEMNSVVDTAKTQKETDLKAMENRTDTSLADYLKDVVGAGSISSSADRSAEDKAGKELDEYTSQLEQEQLANRRQIEALQKNNPQGLFGGGLEQEVNRLNRDSLSKQADIAILQAGAGRRYDRAKSIADRQVEMKMEQSKALIEAKKFYYEQNKADFTKAEERMYNEHIKEEEKRVKKEEETEKAIADIKLNVVASGYATPDMLAKLGKAKSLDEALAISGKYGTDYLTNEVKKATIAKSNADIRKTNAEIDKIQKEISSLETPLDTSGLPNTTSGFVTKLMASAKNEKDLDAGERQSLSKARTVIGQLDALQSNIAKQNGTGLIKGKVGNLLEKFGANASVGTINAQLQAIVPNLARGVYGEVGVLTDNDIANYRKTLGRLDRPQDQNDAVLALTLKTVLNSMENTLSGASNSNINVSGWTQDYLKIKNQINNIEDRIGVSKEAVNNLILQDKTLSAPIKEMYQQGLTDREILEALNAT